jgi:hypothetical protein
MEAPKRIWAEPRFEREYQRHVWDGVACHWKSTPRRAKDGPSQEYIRADVVEAMVAEERERCAETAEKWATDAQREFGSGGPAADIRGKAEK